MSRETANRGTSGFDIIGRHAVPSHGLFWQPRPGEREVRRLMPEGSWLEKSNIQDKEGHA